MISDLNDVWLQIIIDNGEDCKKALNRKLETLTEKADSLRCAERIRQEHGKRMADVAAFWCLFVEEQQ